MAKLEELTPGAHVEGIRPGGVVTVEKLDWHGNVAATLVFRDAEGRLGEELLSRSDEARLKIAAAGRPWSFDAAGDKFKLVSEAHRIRLAHLFDPLLAVHTSRVQPLPHQITAVYESMLPRQPLRFLLADDPGAGKTIMAGLLIKELIARGDLQRCLIVCPGSLAEQWQDELLERFQLEFQIMTNDKLEAAATGNWFIEAPLVIARLDKLSRNEDLQEKLKVPECHWDLVVVDEAHKMSASYFGNETKYTKRYRLGQLLGGLTRHLLLMTATPHNGKDEDFQLFMALLDSDRFEGRPRDATRVIDTSDLMRRMVKEKLVKFDGRPLFPERIAHTVPYRLSELEAQLYSAVTNYVREQFNRAEAMLNDKRAGTVGFALTILQRRLASSPEAIYRSIERRRERLEKRLREVELVHRGQSLAAYGFQQPELDPDEIEDYYEADTPGDEHDALENEVVDQATAARTIDELKLEIETLRTLEALARRVRNSGEDRKWQELSALLGEIFSDHAMPAPAGERDFARSAAQKLVVFTEQRDTLNYLVERISTVLGRASAVRVIHGAMPRDERKKAEEAFKFDPTVQVLIATDAAGEGINLQRAHLMVNYDLPWNPNRLEQRFGRIHRIGQTEVCHLWNLVAAETREGDVYQTLLKKLDEVRKALDGEVFDVLGKLQFEGKPLRDLMIEAIRYGDLPETRAKLYKIIESAVDPAHCQALLEDRALASEALDTSKIQRIREGMERAEARRLQPHYIEAFFKEAFGEMGGALSPREPKRFEIRNVPAVIRQRDRLIGLRAPILTRYERVTFDKDLATVPGRAPAAFICPGHPLLDATLDLTMERYGTLLKQGTVLVDDRDEAGDEPSLLVYLEHAIHDAVVTPSGGQRQISRQLQYVELRPGQEPASRGYAPYLDLRPLAADEPAADEILARPECAWIGADAEATARSWAAGHLVPGHLEEVRSRRLAYLEKAKGEIVARLTSEIRYWDNRAHQLKNDEAAGKTNARLNSQQAAQKANDLDARLKKRIAQIENEKMISASPPKVLGGLVVVPRRFLDKMRGLSVATMPKDTMASAARAREIVMAYERSLGHAPVDREYERVGYDIESRDASTGHLRMIEVKGRQAEGDTIVVTRNEILIGLNRSENYYLALVIFDGPDAHRLYYLRQPFNEQGMTSEFSACAVQFDVAQLIARAERVG